jgi:hypothetical protein
MAALLAEYVPMDGIDNHAATETTFIMPPLASKGDSSFIKDKGPK